MGLLRTRFARTVQLLLALSLVITMLPATLVARADTKPVNEADPATPVTVSADPLPTVQMNGVAWSQVVVGNTVYVGGEFTQARPAGAALGTNETPRANLLAYDIRTGNLLSSWVADTNGPVYAVAASPDGSRIYAGGAFTEVNGVTRNRIVALNPTTGAVVTSFAPRATSRVSTIAATNSRVYFGGYFTSVSGEVRNKFAAVQASNGALLSWAPDAQGGHGRAMVISPDGSKIALGGNFTTLNGSNNPGYGLALVDADTGASLPMPANSLIRNGGPNAAILSLTSDGQSIYASGYTYGSGGNLEAVTRINWSDGAIVWVADCHGDTYSVWPMGDAVYAASHSHYCGNMPDGFPQTDPWTMHWGNAFSKSVVGVLTADIYGYFNFAGTPSPNLLKWEPQFTNGTFTGQNQAGWHVTGNDDYLVYGGEFPRTGASNTTQQGLVRYARRELAPNKMGPMLSGTYMKPKATSLSAGTVRLSWPSNWDRDNEQLTYHVRRDNVEIAQIKGLSSEWKRPPLGYVDSGLVAGRQYTYRIFTTDPYGNESRGDSATVTVRADGVVSEYADAVLDDGASLFWRLGEDRAATSNTAYDWAGFNDGRMDAGVSGNEAGAILSDTDPASSFSGTTSGLVTTTNAVPGPNVFTIESWFKTTTRAGGKIVGFGNRNTGNSTSYDRHVYMDTSGRVLFGVYPGTSRTLTSSASYNDGAWHHVVASLGPDGMALFIDGRRVAARADTTYGQGYSGYWRVGGDTSWSGAAYFAGQIDDVAIYPSVLSAPQIRSHYLKSGRDLQGATPPADAYGAAVHASDPDLYWRLAELTGQVALDASPNAQNGVYANGTRRGETSGIGLDGDYSAGFDGTNDVVASANTFTNPSVFTQELWFKTSTTVGGKLIGFGSSQTALSGSYDRHVYMLNTGQLRFGTYTGVENVVTSPSAYNDGKWHHMVAEQGPGGMKLFVDAQLVGENPQTGAQNYTGYWRVGGDRVWAGASSNYFAGQIDEVAVYSRILSADERTDHFVKGGGRLPNVVPVADFTFEVNKTKVSFAAAASDSDGTVESYLWDFGDGVTSTEENPVHTFPSVGDFSVKLTVTDNDGGTGTVTKTVTTVANESPVADFTFVENGLSVQFTGDGTDADGTVESYAWDFGDGSTSAQRSPQHVFDEAGTYDVTLTVTDNSGATGSVTKKVSVEAAPEEPQGALATDAFSRTVSNDWGNADKGGAWTRVGSASLFSVADGVGRIRITSAGSGPRALLESVESSATEASVKVSLDKVADGGGIFLSFGVRATGTNDYRAKVKVASNGALTLYLVRFVNGVETVITSRSLGASFNYAVGDTLVIKAQAKGTTSTELKAKVWKSTQAEPAWQLENTDSTPAELRGTGGIALATYLSGSTTNTPVTVTFDDLHAERME